MSIPATTIFCRAFIAALKRASSAMVAFDVTSPPLTEVFGQNALNEIVRVEVFEK